MTLRFVRIFLLSLQHGLPPMSTAHDQTTKYPLLWRYNSCLNHPGQQWFSCQVKVQRSKGDNTLPWRWIGIKLMKYFKLFHPGTEMSSEDGFSESASEKTTKHIANFITTICKTGLSLIKCRLQIQQLQMYIVNIFSYQVCLSCIPSMGVTFWTAGQLWKIFQHLCKLSLYKEFHNQVIMS